MEWYWHIGETMIRLGMVTDLMVNGVNNSGISAVSVMVAERGGVDLMPEQNTKPVNKYLPPRPKTDIQDEPPTHLASLAAPTATGFLGWLDQALAKL